MTDDPVHDPVYAPAPPAEPARLPDGVVVLLAALLAIGGFVAGLYVF